MRIRWARSATRHRISRASSRFVIEHCGLIAWQPAPSGLARSTPRLIFLGDDADGQALEVMAVELGGDELLVIHAMPLREKYRPAYEEARKWLK